MVWSTTTDYSLAQPPMNDAQIQNSNTGRRLGYVRVSDEDQTEQLQVDALTVVGCDQIFHDHGVSGALHHRPGLDSLLGCLTPGDTLLVWKLDRLGRSTVHLLQLLSDLRERQIDFVAVTQGIDTTTSIGRMLYGQLAVFAEFEREQISDRTKAGMAAAKRRGQHLGRPRAFSDRDMARIVQEMATGRLTPNDIATRYHVSRQTVCRAISTYRSKV